MLPATQWAVCHALSDTTQIRGGFCRLPPAPAASAALSRPHAVSLASADISSFPTQPASSSPWFDATTYSPDDFVTIHRMPLG